MHRTPRPSLAGSETSNTAWQAVVGGLCQWAEFPHTLLMCSIKPTWKLVGLDLQPKLLLLLFVVLQLASQSGSYWWTIQQVDHANWYSRGTNCEKLRSNKTVSKKTGLPANLDQLALKMDRIKSFYRFHQQMSRLFFHKNAADTSTKPERGQKILFYSSNLPSASKERIIIFGKRRYILVQSPSASVCILHKKFQVTVSNSIVLTVTFGPVNSDAPGRCIWEATSM